MSRDCVINCITVGKFCSSLSRGSVDNANDPCEWCDVIERGKSGEKWKYIMDI